MQSVAKIIFVMDFDAHRDFAFDRPQQQLFVGLAAGWFAFAVFFGRLELSLGFSKPALIKALQDKTIMSAGLDVYLREPEVPAELLAMDHIVLFPHLGSATIHTRERMEQLVVDNLLAWDAGMPPLTPVAETPWPPKGRA